MSRKFPMFAVCALVSAAASAQYCAVNNTLTVCGSDESISSVSVDAFVNGSGCGPGGYEDHTGVGSIPLTVGVAANVSVTIANFWGTDKVTLWIDLNGDLAFGAGEAFDLPDSNAGGNGGASVTVSGTLTLPACTPPGLGRRMRVAMNYNMADPQPACGSYNFGAWEDYLVDIAGPVIGDTCACPLTAALGATSGNATGATYDSSLCNGGDANLWYTFTPPASDLYSFEVAGAVFYGVYSGACGSLTNVACSTFTGIDVVALTAGVTYFVEVGDWSASSAFTLNINPFVPAVNDECSGALPIYSGVTAGISSANATTSPNSPCAGMGRDVWYAYTASCSGVHTFTTCGYSFDDTVLALYDGCGGTLLICVDDACGVQTTISANLTAGSTYLLRVGGFFSGPFNTSIEIVNPFQLTFPTTPGFVSMCMTGGTPFGGYFTAITVNQGAFPNGTFYGIDITFSELFFQLTAGAPFVGILDGNGSVLQGPYAVPPFLTLYGVALNNIFVPGFTATPPTSVTTI